MLEIKIIEPGDFRLKEKCNQIKDFDNKTYYENLINKIKEICIREKAYGSAAPQFGILKRLILIMTEEEIISKDSNDLKSSKINYKITPYFNPKIIEERGMQLYYEGCLSVKNTIGKVIRPYYIKLEAQDIDGNYFIEEVNGFKSIILCHEIDHLDGLEFTDKAEEIIYDVTQDERIAIRNKYPYQVISKDCEYKAENKKIRVLKKDII